MIHSILTRTMLSIFLMSLGLMVQGQETVPADNLQHNITQSFSGSKAMFYYTDLARTDQDMSGAAYLLAVSPEKGGFVYNTMGNQVYVVGCGDSIYIAEHRNHSELREMVVNSGCVASWDEIADEKRNKTAIEGRDPDKTNVLALFFVQVTSDVDPAEKVVYVEGVGISIIEDIDPTLRRSLEIPNKSLFSIATEGQDCHAGSGTTHKLLLRY